MLYADWRDLMNAPASWKTVLVASVVLSACGSNAYTIGPGGERFDGTRNDDAYAYGGTAEGRAQRERHAEAARYTGGGTSAARRRVSECGSGGDADATRGIALVFASLVDAITGPQADATIVSRSSSAGSSSAIYIHDSRSSVERLQDGWNAGDAAAQQGRANCERDVAARDVQRTLAAADALQSKLQCVVTASADLRTPGESVADAAARGQLLLSQWALERTRLEAAGHDLSGSSGTAGPRSAAVARSRLTQALAGLQTLARGAAVQLGTSMDARRAALRAGTPVPRARAAYRALSVCLSNHPPRDEADRGVVVGEIARLRERAAECNAASISLSVVVDGETGVPTRVTSESGTVPRCVVDAVTAMQLPVVDRDSWTLQFPLGAGAAAR